MFSQHPRTPHNLKILGVLEHRPNGLFGRVRIQRANPENAQRRSPADGFGYPRRLEQIEFTQPPDPVRDLRRQ
jgi:hypothetical protein